MTRYTEFAYAQARIQARHGQRPDQRAWERLLAIASLSNFLQAARKGPLREWILELGEHSSEHDMELMLRRHFRHHVAEVARWMPRRWQPGIEWTRHLIDLPVLEHLFAGEPAPAWAREDEELRPAASDVTAERMSGLHGSAKAPLVMGKERGLSLGEAWLQHWRQLWPQTRTDDVGNLHRLIRTVTASRAALTNPRLSSSAPVREELEHQLTLLFRRSAHQPAMAFIHLTLTALLVERLRGALAVRMLFKPREAAE